MKRPRKRRANARRHECVSQSVDLACSLTAVAPRSFRPQARLAARPTCLANCIGFRWIMDNNSPYLLMHLRPIIIRPINIAPPQRKFLPTRRARAETMQMNRVADGPQADDELPLHGPTAERMPHQPVGSARCADYPLITL